MSSTYPEAQERVANVNRSELSGRLTTLLDPTSAASEAYRILSANLLYAWVDTVPTMILVTSPSSSEGKSTVCANLGVALAQAGRRTLIVDCGLRKPTMHQIFGLAASPGIVDIVVKGYSLSEAYQEPLRDLKVLTVGSALYNPAKTNPAKLLGSQALSEVFAETQTKFDHVLVDSSAGLVADSILLAAQSDGVLVTFDARKTRKADLQRTVQSLETVGANVLGVVMNRVRSDERGRQ